MTVTAGDGPQKSKIATLQALSALTQAQITADNWKLYAAQLEILDIPEKEEIIDGWRQKFEAPQMGQGMPGMEMQGMAAPGMAPEAIAPSAPLGEPLPLMSAPM